MPAILCTCGDRISYGEIPCPHEWLFISDVDFDAYEGSVDCDVLYRAMKSFLKCEKCGRLWVFWNGFKHPPEEFVSAQRPHP